jgi:hypothetical protein
MVNEYFKYLFEGLGIEWSEVFLTLGALVFLLGLSIMIFGWGGILVFLFVCVVLRIADL